MKRGYFIILFLLIALAFFYSDSSTAAPVRPGECPSYNADNCPSETYEVVTLEEVKDVIGCSNKKTVSVCVVKGKCFSPDTPGLANSNQVPLNFEYEGFPTRNFWTFDLNSGKVIVKTISAEKKVVDEYLDVNKASVSTENCEYYPFVYNRISGLLSYELPLDSEGSANDGGKLCYYKFTDEAASAIVSLGGIPNVDNICPDLQNGRPSPAGTSCSPTARCDIAVTRGEASFYGITLEKDNCGGVVVKEDNDGKPIPENELAQRAESFMQGCVTKDISGNLLIYGDIIKTGMGGYPEVKTALDLKLEGVKDGKMPKKAIFKTRVEGGGFIALGDYKNTFIAGVGTTLSIYAETTPDLFRLIKEAYDNDKFIPTGALMKINADGKTIDEIYLVDTRVYTEIFDRKITEWFGADIIIEMNFNNDGSANIEVKSRTKSDKGGYDTGEKVYTTTVDKDRAKKILIDMLVRFELAKDKPLGERNGEVTRKILMPDLGGLIKMTKEGRLVKGGKIPITQTGLVFKEDDTYDKRIDYIKREIKDLLEYLNSIRTTQPRTSLDDKGFFIFGAGAEYA